MKAVLRKLCAPVLNIFEQGTEPYKYKPLNRTILNVVGGLFLLLAIALIYIVPASLDGKWLPVVIFGTASLVCLMVGGLGTDRAVSKIWGNK